MAAFQANAERFGREWIMIANPTYGSFDTAPFGEIFFDHFLHPGELPGDVEGGNLGGGTVFQF